MRGDFLAILGLICGFLLIIKGFDTLTEWRAWLFGLVGLVFFLAAIIRIVFRVKRFLNRGDALEAKS